MKIAQNLSTEQAIAQNEADFEYTEHVHEWLSWDSVTNSPFCRHLGCPARLKGWDFPEVLRRYLAHDALVAALEGLNPTGHDCVCCYEAWDAGSTDVHHADTCALNNALRLANGEAS